MDKQTRKALKHIAPGDKVLYFDWCYNRDKQKYERSVLIELIVRRNLKFRGSNILIVYDKKFDSGPAPAGLYFYKKEDLDCIRKQIPDYDLNRYAFLRATDVFLSFSRHNSVG